MPPTSITIPNDRAESKKIAETSITKTPLGPGLLIFLNWAEEAETWSKFNSLRRMILLGKMELNGKGHTNKEEDPLDPNEKSTGRKS